MKRTIIASLWIMSASCVPGDDKYDTMRMHEFPEESLSVEDAQRLAEFKEYYKNGQMESLTGWQIKMLNGYENTQMSPGQMIEAEMERQLNSLNLAMTRKDIKRKTEKLLEKINDLYGKVNFDQAVRMQNARIYSQLQGGRDLKTDIAYGGGLSEIMYSNRSAFELTSYYDDVPSYYEVLKRYDADLTLIAQDLAEKNPAIQSKIQKFYTMIHKGWLQKMAEAKEEKKKKAREQYKPKFNFKGLAGWCLFLIDERY